MKPKRQFRPFEPVALEERIAPSNIPGGHPVPPAHVRAGATSPAASNATFSANIAATIAAGLPVMEQTTTRYNDRSIQTATRLIRPDPLNSSSLTTSIVNLRHNGGTEMVSDFSYTSISGNTVRVVTTNLPDGTTQTQNETLQAQGNTTLINGSIKLPGNGGIDSISGSTTNRGPVTITDKTITDANGQVTKHHIVTIHRGELQKTVTDTETLPNGTHQVTRSTTTIVRLQPPASVANGFQASAPATPPTLA